MATHSRIRIAPADTEAALDTFTAQIIADAITEARNARVLGRPNAIVGIAIPSSLLTEKTREATAPVLMAIQERIDAQLVELRRTYGIDKVWCGYHSRGWASIGLRVLMTPYSLRDEIAEALVADVTLAIANNEPCSTYSCPGHTCMSQAEVDNILLTVARKHGITCHAELIHWEDETTICVTWE